MTPRGRRPTDVVRVCPCIAPTNAHNRGRAWRATVAGGVAVIALLAACTTATGGRARPANPAAHAGGLLTVAITQPGSLEPQNTYESQGALVQQVLCEPLLVDDPRTGRLRPGLAASWLVSDGGKRITVRLRKGARFSDGEPVTAEDVALSLSRAASAEYASNVAALLEPIDGYDEIHGDRETGRAQDRRRLRGVSIIDGQSFSIVLKRSQADFVRVLAHPIAAPVPHRVVDRDPDAFARRPVCAGPYELAAAWTPGDAVIHLRRNPVYRAAGPVFTRGGAGYAERIDFHVVADPDAGVREWQSGAVDVAAVPRADVTSARQAGADLLERPGSYTDFIGLPDSAGSPFADPAVRVALSQAIDRTAIASGTYGGGRIAARGFLPPSLGAVARPSACAVAAPLTADLVAARAVFARHAELTSQPLKLYFNDEFDNRILVEAVARQWHDGLGLDAVPTAISWTDFQALARRGVDGAFRFGWQVPYPSADLALAPLFATSAIGRDNLSRFSNQPFDRLLARTARTAVDESDRNFAYRQLEDKLCAAMPLIPVTFSRVRWLIRGARVAAAVPDPIDVTAGLPMLRELALR